MKTLATLILSLFLGLGFQGILGARDPAQELQSYRQELKSLRAEFGGVQELPDVRFFLFGMGNRAKLLYRDGKLINCISGSVERRWNIASDLIVPSDYLVVLKLKDGKEIRIAENKTAVWIENDDGKTALMGTRSPVKLPDFAPHRYARVLRVLHQELLVNILPQGPVPNIFVYRKPWYRDSAMMAIAFQKTGNIGLVRSWILKLRDPYDRNNAGETEADNLGQALFLISLVSDKSHPAVKAILAEVPKFHVTTPEGLHIRGRSDFSEHPMYQTKWLKYGLRSLDLPDPYVIPKIQDGYSALFWMDYTDAHVPGRDSDDRAFYPYLGWACDHYHGDKKSPIGNRDYPLTWEQQASQADYPALQNLDPIYVEQKLAAPHTWHAAEVFLYLMEDLKGD